FANMVERSKRKGYNFPYLRDESQKVAESYGAVCTPDFFVFDSARKLRYSGKLDDSKETKAMKKQVMREVLDAVLAGKQPPTNYVPSMGCSIKWKSGHWRLRPVARWVARFRFAAPEPFSPRRSPRRREPSRHSKKEYTAPRFPLRRYARRTRAASSGFSLSSSTNFLVFSIARVNSSAMGIVARWAV